MAANQGYTTTTMHSQTILAHQAHATALAAAKLQAQMDAEERRRAFREATTEECDRIISLACVEDPPYGVLMEFRSFPKLPVEMRLEIWKYAIDVPRFLELTTGLDMIDTYCGINPPPLLMVCKEAQEEVAQAYRSYHDAVRDINNIYAIHLRWVRFDKDVIHIKPLPDSSFVLSELSQIHARLGHTIPIQQHSRLNSQANVNTDKWAYRPRFFDQIKNLAISRDLLIHMPDDCEPFIRHFFPNLLTLLVLIDDETDIEEHWGIHDLEYAPYEMPLHEQLRMSWNIHNVPRVDYAAKCKGPFKEAKLNIDYRLEIEYEMRKRFEKEEYKYNFYTAPRVRVLGASVPVGLHVNECGRLPFKTAIARKNKYDANPFGDFAHEDDSIVSL